MKKKTPRAKLKLKLEKMSKDIVKIRDGNFCMRCWSAVAGSNRHCSHIIPVSADGRLALDPDNMFIFCFHCHINWWHKNPIEAAEWVNDNFPDRVKKLREIQKTNKGKGPIKLSELQEIEDRLNEMTQKIK